MPDTEKTDRDNDWPGSRIDLEGMTEEDLMDLIKASLERLPPSKLSGVIEAVQTMRRTKEEEVKDALLTEFRERALQMGISLTELFPSGQRRTRSDAGQPLAPKYRGPGGEVWSGRGRQPNWLSALEATGHDKEEFRIKEEKRLS
jgi:DNA-binding protein H-NS